MSLKNIDARRPLILFANFLGVYYGEKLEGVGGVRLTFDIHAIYILNPSFLL